MILDKRPRLESLALVTPKRQYFVTEECHFVLVLKAPQYSPRMCPIHTRHRQRGVFLHNVVLVFPVQCETNRINRTNNVARRETLTFTSFFRHLAEFNVFRSIATSYVSLPPPKKNSSHLQICAFLRFISSVKRL